MMQSKLHKANQHDAFSALLDVVSDDIPAGQKAAESKPTLKTTQTIHAEDESMPSTPFTPCTPFSQRGTPKMAEVSDDAAFSESSTKCSPMMSPTRTEDIIEHSEYASEHEVPEDEDEDSGECID